MSNYGYKKKISPGHIWTTLYLEETAGVVAKWTLQRIFKTKCILGRLGMICVAQNTGRWHAVSSTVRVKQPGYTKGAN